MEQGFNHSTNTVRAVSKLMDKIGSTCDQLLGVLELSKGSVSSYGVKITDDLMGTEFVDRVVIYLLLLKKHLYDLSKHASTQFEAQDDVHGIIAHLTEMWDKLNTKMLENNYFHNTYGYLVEDIVENIDAITQKLPVKCEVMAIAN